MLSHHKISMSSGKKAADNAGYKEENSGSIIVADGVCY